MSDRNRLQNTSANRIIYGILTNVNMSDCLNKCLCRLLDYFANELAFHRLICSDFPDFQGLIITSIRLATFASLIKPHPIIASMLIKRIYLYTEEEFNLVFIYLINFFPQSVPSIINETVSASLFRNSCKWHH